MSVKSCEEQGEFESRKVWKEVADGIRKGDFASAQEAKVKIEVCPHISFLYFRLDTHLCS